MKKTIALAAALAAGLLPFAANASEMSTVRSLVQSLTVAAISVDAIRQGASTAQSDLGFPALATFDVVPKPSRAVYHGMIARHAAANNVPLALAHAVVSVESNYRPKVRGSAGEVGLMQIKPATARGLGYRGSAAGLYDPDTNLRFGMMYLGKARMLGGGTTCGTILKYNAGHAAKRMNPVSRAYCGKVMKLLAS